MSDVIMTNNGGLPPGWAISQDTLKNETYLKFEGHDMITLLSGARRVFHGIDENTRRRAVKAAWRYHEGHDYETYTIAL